MQINRLLEIVIILLNSSKVTAKELADKFGVSIRTIYRDLEILSTSNIPIYTTRGSQGGISLLENYTLDKRIVNEEEQKEILAALQSLQVVGVSDNEVLLKLSSLFQSNQNESWIEIDFTEWGSTIIEKEFFELLKKSILQNIVVTFTYFNSYRQSGVKEVEPVKLLYKAHHWYLLAFDQTKDDFRVYRLSRIKDLQLLNKHFIKKSSEHFVMEKDMVEQFDLILKFDSVLAYRVYDLFSDDDIEELEDGSMLVNMTFPYGDWPIGFVLSFGSNVEVVEPLWLKESVQAEVKKIMELYRI